MVDDEGLPRKKQDGDQGNQQNSAESGGGAQQSEGQAESDQSGEADGPVAEPR